MYEITFQFENGAQEVHFSAAPGSTILEAAKAANVAIDAPCNGNGSCGKCRVKLVSGDVTGMQTGHISDEDYAATLRNWPGTLRPLRNTSAASITRWCSKMW